MDKLIEIIQGVLQDILQDVFSIQDLMNDKHKRRLFESIMSRYSYLSEYIQEVVPQEILRAYQLGFAEAGQAMRQIGIGEVVGNLSTFVHMNAVRELAQQTVEDLQASIRTAQQLGIQAIEDKLYAIQKALAEGTLAGMNKKNITKTVAMEFQQIGLTGFITRDNKRLPLDFYAMTVTRTKSRQANTEAHYNRYEENNVKFVQITERHPTCHICAKRNGLIVTIGNHRQNGVPHWEDVGLPPFHPNCRHSIRPVLRLEGRVIKPFNDNNDPRTAKQKELYDNEQKIRRVANEEKKQWERMRAAGVEGVPNTLSAFRRMKRKNDSKWKALQEKYRANVAEIQAGRNINPSVRRA